MEQHTLPCPLCNDNMLYEQIAKQKQTFSEPVTHIWVCNSCPSILVEWSDVEDTKAFAKRFGNLTIDTSKYKQVLE